MKEKLTPQQSEALDQNRKGSVSEVASSSDNTLGDLSVKTLEQIALEGNDWPFQTKEPSPSVPPETLGSNSDSDKVEPTDDVLNRTVSFCCHLKKDFSNVSCSTNWGTGKPVLVWNSLWKLEEVGVKTQL